MLPPIGTTRRHAYRHRSLLPLFRLAAGIPGNVAQLEQNVQLNNAMPGTGAVDTLDLAASRGFQMGRARIDVRAEAFSVTNRRNYTLVGRILNDATFGPEPSCTPRFVFTIAPCIG